MADYQFRLTVTDDNGATHSTIITVEVIEQEPRVSIWNGTEWVATVQNWEVLTE